LRFDSNLATVLFDDTVDHVDPQTGAVADGLGGEIRFERCGLEVPS
jgi:hypothetical protein